MRRALVVVVAVLAVVVVAGCGGDDGGGKASAKQVYAQQLAGAGKPLQEAFADADQAGANISSAQIIGHLDEQAATVEDTVKKMQAITPPAGARGDAPQAHRRAAANWPAPSARAPRRRAARTPSR